MNKIVFPLKPGIQGSTVADLQAALQLCLDRSVILANDTGTRQELSTALKPEHEKQIYSDVTRKLISIFQKEKRIPASDMVDEPTANALNALLKELGMLDQPVTEPPMPRPYAVSGQVRREDGLPLKGGLVRAFHETGQFAIRLGKIRLMRMADTPFVTSC